MSSSPVKIVNLSFRLHRTVFIIDLCADHAAPPPPTFSSRRCRRNFGIGAPPPPRKWWRAADGLTEIDNICPYLDIIISIYVGCFLDLQQAYECDYLTMCKAASQLA
jgi:hypothetical protein